MSENKATDRDNRAGFDDSNRFKTLMINRLDSNEKLVFDLLLKEDFRSFIVKTESSDDYYLDSDSYIHIPFSVGCFHDENYWEIYETDERGIVLDERSFYDAFTALIDAAQRRNLSYLPSKSMWLYLEAPTKRLRNTLRRRMINQALNTLSEIDTLLELTDHPDSLKKDIKLLNETLYEKEEKDQVATIEVMDFFSAHYLRSKHSSFFNPDIIEEKQFLVDSFHPTCLTVLSNKQVICGSSDSTLRVWDASTGERMQILKGHNKRITCVAVLPDGRVVSGSDDDTLKVWDASTGQCLQTLEGHKGLVRCVAVLPDGRVVSGSDDGMVRVWDADTGQCLQTLEGHESIITCVAVLPDGRVVSGSYDRTLRVWDATTGECAQTLEGHRGAINCAAVLPDRRVVSGSYDRTLRVWDATTGECAQTLEGHEYPINCVAVLPDGRVVSGSYDSTLRVWDATTGECAQTLEGHESYISCVAVLPDGRVVSGSYDRTLRVWNTYKGQCLQTLAGHEGPITCVAELRDGRVISGSWDHTLRVWDADTGQCLQTLKGKSNDSGQVAAYSRTSIKRARLCHLNTPETIQINKTPFYLGCDESRVDYCIKGSRTISRRHAVIILENSNYYIVDLDSTNHTFVNGEMIQSNTPVKLSQRDNIRLAEDSFIFLLE